MTQQSVGWATPNAEMWVEGDVWESHQPGGKALILLQVRAEKPRTQDTVHVSHTAAALELTTRQKLSDTPRKPGRK